MTTFDNREKAFENKFAHDSELQFKVDARARNQLCLWAAERLGKEGEDAAAYAKQALMDSMKPGAPSPVERVLQELQAAGVAVTEEEVKTRFTELLAQVKIQVMQES